MAESQEITFGIEIEAVLVYNPSRLPDGGANMQKLIYEQLTSQSIRRRCQVEACKKDHYSKLPIYYPAPGGFPDYRKWRPIYDQSVKLTQKEANSFLWQQLREKGLEAYGLEVVSRVLNASGETPDPDGAEDEHGLIQINIEDEISHVLKMLHSFNNGRYLRCFVNSTSGLHVHLGTRSGQLSVEVVRGMRALFTAFEKQIDTILPTTRIGGYTGSMGLTDVSDQTPKYAYPQEEEGVFHMTTSQYNKPESNTWLSKLEETLTDLEKKRTRTNKVRTGEIHACDNIDDLVEILPNDVLAERKKARLAGLDKRLFPYNMISDEAGSDMEYAVQAAHVPGWLYMVASAKTMSDLRDMQPYQYSGHSATVNLDNVNYNSGSGKRTIEIRCHPGSLYLAEIMAWVNTLVSMVEYLQEHTSVNLAKLLLRWSDSTFTFLSLLEAVGASQETQAFYQKLLQEDYANDRRTWIVQHQYIGWNSYDGQLLEQLLELVEEDRVAERVPKAVQERIRHKIESGLYGKLPFTLVNGVLGANLAKQSEALVIRRNERSLWNRSIERAAKEMDAHAAIDKKGGVLTDSDDEP